MAKYLVQEVTYIDHFIEADSAVDAEDYLSYNREDVDSELLEALPLYDGDYSEEEVFIDIRGK